MGKASCDAAKVMLHARECNAQNTNQNEWPKGKTTKLPQSAEIPH
jgi:hypothetical protein